MIPALLFFLLNVDAGKVHFGSLKQCILNKISLTVTTIFHDLSLKYHGIGHNVPVLMSILSGSGILTKQDADRLQIRYNRNSVGGYNGDNKLSLALSPQFPLSKGDNAYRAFRSFCKPWITLVVKDIPIPNPPQIDYSGFDDEVHVDSVPVQNIQGIMIPNDACDQPLSRLPLGLTALGGEYGLVDRLVSYIIGVSTLCTKPQPSALIQTIESMFVQADPDDSLMSLMSRWRYQKARNQEIEKMLTEWSAATFADVLGRDANDITLLDVIEYYLTHVVKYNSEGYVLKLQT